jgi:hypothetical protein
VVVGATLPLIGGAVASADLPPLPTPSGLPQSGQPITFLVPHPSVIAFTLPPGPSSCLVYTNFDNTGATPPGTVFRGQSACGAQIAAPVLTGQAVLIDPFGNVVAAGNSYGQTWGVGTSRGRYLLQPGQVPPGLSGGGPVPGLNYTISYDTSITLTAPQTWGPSTQDGCSVSGQTLHCVVTTPYSYIPGTQGGFSPG